MKDILLAFSIIWCSQNGVADCSTWNVFGAGSPESVDGGNANYTEMVEAQQLTRAYIERLERTIEYCSLDDGQQAYLVDAMKASARRYNRALAQYRETQAAVVVDARP